MIKPYSEIADEPREDIRKCDLRLRIAKTVGLKTRPDTPFGKLDLNSIHAYLTGEHHFPKWQWGTGQSSSFTDLRVAVAEAAGVTGYALSPEALDDGAEQPKRPYRKSELIEMCERIEGSKDQRPVPDGREASA